MLIAAIKPLQTKRRAVAHSLRRAPWPCPGPFERIQEATEGPSIAETLKCVVG